MRARHRRRRARQRKLFAVPVRQRAGRKPGGLAAHAALPALPLDPSLFTSLIDNSMDLSRVVGDPELGDFFRIRAGSLVAAAPIPLPLSAISFMPAALALAALGRRAA